MNGTFVISLLGDWKLYHDIMSETKQAWLLFMATPKTKTEPLSSPGELAHVKGAGETRKVSIESKSGKERSCETSLTLEQAHEIVSHQAKDTLFPAALLAAYAKDSSEGTWQAKWLLILAEDYNSKAEYTRPLGPGKTRNVSVKDKKGKTHFVETGITLHGAYEILKQLEEPEQFEKALVDAYETNRCLGSMSEWLMINGHRKSSKSGMTTWSKKKELPLEEPEEEIVEEEEDIFEEEEDEPVEREYTVVKKDKGEVKFKSKLTKDKAHQILREKTKRTKIEDGLVERLEANRSLNEKQTAWLFKLAEDARQKMNAA